MKPFAIAVAALALGACVQTTARVDPTLSPDDQKREIALQRERGEITYAEAARQQYAIEQATVTLTPQQQAFWQESIGIAAAVDAGQISREDYRARVAEAYSRNVGA
jgi:hypothetical protein